MQRDLGADLAGKDIRNQQSDDEPIHEVNSPTHCTLAGPLPGATSHTNYQYLVGRWVSEAVTVIAGHL